MAVTDDVEIPGTHPFPIKRGAGQTAEQVGKLLDGEPVGQDLLPQPLLQEAGLAIEVATADGHDQVAPQAGGRVGMKQHGSMAGRNLAGTEPGDGAAHRLVGDPRRAPQSGKVTTGGVTIIPLHVAILFTDQHAAQGVA